jgi:hypothetical protein
MQTAERRPTAKASRDCALWLNQCRNIGWPATAMPRLADLWWEYHDDESNLIGSPPSGNEEPK